MVSMVAEMRGTRGTPLVGVADGVGEDVWKFPGAVVAEEAAPGAEGAGDGGGEEAGAGDEVEVEIGEGGEGRGGGGGALAAEDVLGVGWHCVVEDQMGQSPPGPLRWGSATWRVKAAAQAASKALPPRSRTDMPTAEASQ